MSIKVGESELQGVYRETGTTAGCVYWKSVSPYFSALISKMTFVFFSYNRFIFWSLKALCNKTEDPAVRFFYCGLNTTHDFPSSVDL